MSWDSRGAFLEDPHNHWNGYQEDLTGRGGDRAHSGYAVFTHMTQKCGTSIAIPVCDLGVLVGCPHLSPSGECVCALSEPRAVAAELTGCRVEGKEHTAQGHSRSPASAA